MKVFTGHTIESQKRKRKGKGKLETFFGFFKTWRPNIG